MNADIIRILPYHYIHVLDKNTNVSRLIVGPKTFVRQEHELIVTGAEPQRHVVLTPYTYCQIENPIITANAEIGKPTFDESGQVIVRLQDSEIRTSFDYQKPFPLYPREELVLLDDLPLIPRDCAVKFECTRDFTDDNGKKRVAGDEWLEFGPKVIIPKVQVKLVEHIQPQIINSNQALKIEALRACKDSNGVSRRAGEQWLVRDLGFYIP